MKKLCLLLVLLLSLSLFSSCGDDKDEKRDTEISSEDKNSDDNSDDEKENSFLSDKKKDEEKSSDTNKKYDEDEDKEDKTSDYKEIPGGHFISLPDRELNLKGYKIEKHSYLDGYNITLYIDYKNTGKDDNNFSFSTGTRTAAKAYQDGISLDYEGMNDDASVGIKPGVTISVEVSHYLRNLDSDVEYTFEGYSVDPYLEEEAYYTLPIK